MTSKTIIEIVYKLVGDITPYGDADIDKKNKGNLRKAIDVVEDLLCGIDDVSKYYDSPYSSSKDLGKAANSYLLTLKAWLDEKYGK